MDAAELKDDDLHEKRMARLARERQEKADMRADNERLRTQLRFILAYFQGGLMPTDLRDWKRETEAALANASSE